VKRGGGTDGANRLLDQGNYLAYGLAAVAAWVTGIPHGLAVLHGKTRRGGLVFDLADLIKDALILPQAFIAAGIYCCNGRGGQPNFSSALYYRVPAVRRAGFND
jgi:CRISPR-associated endonuclease Cas1 subtype I-F